jgi:energy-coupling factor transport system ATP-binding protein
MNKCISIQNLSFRYEKSAEDALKQLNLDIYEGEYLTILGANGSGKSTLISCINGLLSPPVGAVTVFDNAAPLDPSNDAQLEKIRLAIGTVLQNPDAQFVGSVAEEDAAFGPENLGLGKDEVMRRVNDALSIVGLEHLRKRQIEFLSGGEKQRLAIAGVLALETNSLILDEAASMLDPESAASLLDLLDTLVKRGKTIIHITHNLDDALRSHRSIVLHKGALVFDGSPADLLKRPELEDWGFWVPNKGGEHRSRESGTGRFGCAHRPSRKSEAASTLLPLTPKPTASPLPPLLPPVIRFTSVFYNYPTGNAISAGNAGVPVLSDVSFCVPQNSTVALIGKSGCGKTTLLKHINALLLPSSGSVEVLGTDTYDKKVPLRSLRFKAALAIQSPESALFEAYVADDVAFGPKNAGIRGQALLQRVKTALNDTGLDFALFADREIASLSGGEKRRAALAGVFAMDSEILLLDEPVAGLDGKSTERLLSLIMEQ